MQAKWLFHELHHFALALSLVLEPPFSTARPQQRCTSRLRARRGMLHLVSAFSFIQYNSTNKAKEASKAVMASLANRPNSKFTLNDESLKGVSLNEVSEVAWMQTCQIGPASVEEREKRSPSLRCIRLNCVSTDPFRREIMVGKACA
jgi:hypothetical protein